MDKTDNYKKLKVSELGPCFKFFLLFFRVSKLFHRLQAKQMKVVTKPVINKLIEHYQ